MPALHDLAPAYAADTSRVPSAAYRWLCSILLIHGVRLSITHSTNFILCYDQCARRLGLFFTPLLLARCDPASATARIATAMLHVERFCEHDYPTHHRLHWLQVPLSELDRVIHAFPWGENIESTDWFSPRTGLLRAGTDRAKTWLLTKVCGPRPSPCFYYVHVLGSCRCAHEGRRHVLLLHAPFANTLLRLSTRH